MEKAEGKGVRKGKGEERKGEGRRGKERTRKERKEKGREIASAHFNKEQAKKTK